ncbi:Uncharacterized protein PBTT_03968 [Plasmodiophora brassicae]|uniref:Uncharacterized protein n=1 Tax=Plasmodiophora brassicae TaxID=37360 RepID=A0A0G4J4N5_PLABS|nr:hypothetical protein PBRA_009056 [Plasmodiophora brassicae]SPQ96979.1 unnamed protein product [Plasmodiophora brassicae]
MFLVALAAIIAVCGIGYSYRSATRVPTRSATLTRGTRHRSLSFLQGTTVDVVVETGRAEDLPQVWRSVFVDDGSSFCWAPARDLVRCQRAPSCTVSTFNGDRHVQTRWIYVTIDGLRTRARCIEGDDGDGRAIGLNVIIRYRHVIDYRQRPPRTWTRLPGLRSSRMPRIQHA